METPFPAYKGDEPYIFVSYAHEDAEVVYPEIEWLKDQGFNIWYDEGIAPGHEWHQELADRIDGASQFLYFISPQSAQSEHCQREVHYAIENGKQLLSVHLQAAELPSGLKLSLGSTQAILRHELSELDYRIRLLRAASTHTERGISALDAPVRVGFSSVAIVAGMFITLLVGGIAVGIAMWNSKPPESSADQQLIRFDIDLTLARATTVGQPLAITPDGTQVIFNATGEGGKQLYSRDLSQLDAVPIRGTEDPEGQNGAGSFALSPDSQWVVFNSPYDLTVKKVRLNGGTPTTLAKVPVSNQRGLDWGPNDTIVITPGSYPGLMQVSSKGGAAEPLTTPEEGMVHGGPHFLPDGHSLLFSVSKAGQALAGQIAFLSLESGESKLITEGTSPQFTSSGHLLFYRDGAVWAAGFDSVRGELTSEAVPVVEGVASSGLRGIYSVSRDGKLVYWRGTVVSLQSELVLVERDGAEIPLRVQVRDYREVSVSPDGERIALVIGGKRTDGDLWVYSIEQGNLTRLTFDAAGAFGLQWIESGTKIAFSRSESERDMVYARNADGTGELHSLLASSDYTLFMGPDAAVLTVCPRQSAPCDIAVPAPQEEGGIRLIMSDESHESSPALSPDKRWIVYGSDESGSFLPYVRPFPDVAGGKWLLSDDVVERAMSWAPDGREIIYRRVNDKMMMSVPVATEPTFSAGTPRELFNSGEYLSEGNPRTAVYDAMPDGRFIMIKPQSEYIPKAVVVLNFLQELERLAPTNR